MSVLGGSCTLLPIRDSIHCAATRDSRPFSTSCIYPKSRRQPTFQPSLLPDETVSNLRIGIESRTLFPVQR